MRSIDYLNVGADFSRPCTDRWLRRYVQADRASATLVWLVLRDPVYRNALAAFLVRGRSASVSKTAASVLRSAAALNRHWRTGQLVIDSIVRRGWNCPSRRRLRKLTHRAAVFPRRRT
jgi:hypothetical protein